jgi:hypothetical protein
MATVWPEVVSQAGGPLADVELTDATKADASDLACQSLSGLR